MQVVFSKMQRGIVVTLKTDAVTTQCVTSAVL